VKNNLEIYGTNKKPVIISTAVFILIISGSTISRGRDKIFNPSSAWDYIEITLLVLFTMFFINLFFYVLKRKIILSSEEISSIEIPLFILFNYSNKIASKILWEDMEKLEIRTDVVTGKMKFFYIIGKGGKFIAFSPKAIENSNRLIACIEEKTGKKFMEID